MSVQTTQSGATDDGPVLDLGKLDAFETEAGASPNNSLERVLRQFFRSAPNLLAEMENDHAGEDNAGLARSAQLLAANSDRGRRCVPCAQVPHARKSGEYGES